MLSFDFWAKKKVLLKDLKKSGGVSQTLDELSPPVSYLSVFIPHFIGNPSENHSILRKLYLDFDLPMSKISEITGWSKTVVSDFFKREKTIKLGKKSSQPQYGERMVGGIRLPHQGEQKVILKILNFRYTGSSYRQIAKSLNASGICAKHGGLWSKTTVQQIFKREQEKQK